MLYKISDYNKWMIFRKGAPKQRKKEVTQQHLSAFLIPNDCVDTMVGHQYAKVVWMNFIYSKLAPAVKEVYGGFWKQQIKRSAQQTATSFEWTCTGRVRGAIRFGYVGVTKTKDRYDPQGFYSATFGIYEQNLDLEKAGKLLTIILAEAKLGFDMQTRDFNIFMRRGNLFEDAGKTLLEKLNVSPPERACTPQRTTSNHYFWTEVTTQKRTLH